MHSFTLIHYTQGWRIGESISLSVVPPLGTLVKSNDESVENYNDIYYVDNIMFTDGGENYLFVRPFEGYGKRAPLTENDRIVEALKELTQAVDNLSDNVMSTRGLLL